MKKIIEVIREFYSCKDSFPGKKIKLVLAHLLVLSYIAFMVFGICGEIGLMIVMAFIMLFTILAISSSFGE